MNGDHEQLCRNFSLGSIQNDWKENKPGYSEILDTTAQTHRRFSVRNCWRVSIYAYFHD